MSFTFATISRTGGRWDSAERGKTERAAKAPRTMAEMLCRTELNMNTAFLLPELANTADKTSGQPSGESVNSHSAKAGAMKVQVRCPDCLRSPGLERPAAYCTLTVTWKVVSEQGASEGSDALVAGFVPHAIVFDVDPA